MSTRRNISVGFFLSTSIQLLTASAPVVRWHVRSLAEIKALVHPRGRTGDSRGLQGRDRTSIGHEQPVRENWRGPNRTTKT